MNELPSSCETGSRCNVMTTIHRSPVTSRGSTMIRACRFMVIALLVVPLLAVSIATETVNGATQTQGEPTEVEVVLRLPGDETLGRALEISRKLRENGHVDRITYSVADGDQEVAEIIHSSATPMSVVCSIVETLTEVMVTEVIIKLSDPNEP